MLKKYKFKFNTITLFLVLLLILFTFIALNMGSVNIKISSLFEEGTMESFILRKIRIPRIMGSIFVGAILSVAGVVFQTIFKNDLADSYLLGISSGATFSISLASLLGFSLQNLLALPLAAFSGSLFAAFVILLISRRNQDNLILFGISLNFLLSSLTNLFVYLNKGQRDKIIFWSMGSFSSMTTEKMLLVGVFFIITTLLIYKRNKELDILLLDEQSALSLGVNVKKEKLILLILSSLSTALAVCFCGVIGFVGLMAPHLVRTVNGPNNKQLLILAPLTGGLLMLISDTFSRTILPAGELPVGIITSFFGATLFISIAYRRKRNG
ncbi:MAG: iron ABC transporter permease [Sphaerochaetaceae bacterium]|nr:iron ABC transporter permease [Sphaerochaetaceae bacterium]